MWRSRLVLALWKWGVTVVSNAQKHKPAVAVWRDKSPTPTTASGQPDAHSDVQTVAGGDASADEQSTGAVWRGHAVAAARALRNSAPLPSSRIEERRDPQTPHVSFKGNVTEAHPPRDASPQSAAPAPIEQLHTDELSASTSLDDLFKAILGDQAGDVDDRALLLETVEAQVRGIRDELGLPEPIPEPVPIAAVTAAATASGESAPLSEDESSGAVSGVRATARRVPGLFRLVAGLAWSRTPHPVVVLAVASGAFLVC